jgi:hypothetical protein
VPQGQRVLSARGERETAWERHESAQQRIAELEDTITLREACIRLSCERIAELEADKGAAWNLMQEIVEAHADKTDPNYNQCDEDKCAWCVDALALRPR